MSQVALTTEPLGSPLARELIAALNAELLSLYPPEQCFHDLDPDEIAPGRGRFVVAWVAGAAVGCGAVRLLEAGRAELKRMFVTPALRGRGISRTILLALEDTARELAAHSVVLETGELQPAAIALYESAGYRRVPAFGAYASSPTSICMEKALAE